MIVDASCLSRFFCFLQIYSNPSAWLVLLLTVSINLLLELAWRAYRQSRNPSVAQIYQEILRQPLQRREEATKPGLLSQPSKSLLPIHESKHEEAEEIHTGNADVFKSQIVRAMLRFRNLTGSQFDSAAQAELQNHDAFQTGSKANSTVKPVPLQSSHSSSSLATPGAAAASVHHSPSPGAPFQSTSPTGTVPYTRPPMFNPTPSASMHSHDDATIQGNASQSAYESPPGVIAPSDLTISSYRERGNEEDVKVQDRRVI